MWVPWRAGSTSREQALARQRRAVRGQLRASEARAEAIKAHRKALLKQAKQGKISGAEYRQALRKLEK